MTFRPAGNDEKQRDAAKAEGRPSLIVTGCFLSLGVLGWLDYITGYEMSFFVFYSVPVGLAAWYAGRWPAIAVALAATLTWLLADYLDGAKYSAPFFYCWNGTIHFAAFIINAVTIAKIKSDLDRRHALAAELGAAQATLRAVAAIWPACPACGQRRENRTGDGKGDVTQLAREHPEFADALCPDCRSNGAKAGEHGGYSVSSSSSS